MSVLENKGKGTKIKYNGSLKGEAGEEWGMGLAVGLFLSASCSVVLTLEPSVLRHYKTKLNLKIFLIPTT